jgi:hypothetical protein
MLVMTTFVALFLPETKGVPIEEMNHVWSRHWFWGSYVTAHDVAAAGAGGGGNRRSHNV